MPELDWPDLSDAALLATLDTWLAPAFANKTRLDALTPGELGNALHSLLDWTLRQRVEELAPRGILVPSGLERRITYAAEDRTVHEDVDAAAAPVGTGAGSGDRDDGGRGDRVIAPVLAVKLQELFGLADTPRIVEGRIPLTLHLLSPAGRPLQVTQDLHGFWERTYPEVKKEMKGRYPKHPWPENPWSATATHRAKRKGT
jgi:ATP-dependent helicase HrpB